MLAQSCVASEWWSLDLNRRGALVRCRVTEDPEKGLPRAGVGCSGPALQGQV